ncbi:MAG: GNAT family N-acetyltransferase [Bdellovibrionota bacterium]
MLRTYLPEDYAGLGDVLNDQQTMEALRPYFQQTHWTPELVKQRYGKFISEQYSGRGLGFTVITRSDNRVVGDCGFKNISLPEKQAEFGLILHASVWGTGVAKK